MGVIVRNGNTYGGFQTVDAKENQVLIGDGKQGAKGSKFYTDIKDSTLILRGDLSEDQDTITFIGMRNNQLGGVIHLGKNAGVTILNNSWITMNQGNLQITNSQGKIEGESRFTIAQQSQVDIDGHSEVFIHENVKIHIDGESTVDGRTFEQSSSYSGGPMRQHMFTDNSFFEGGFSPRIFFHGASLLNIGSNLNVITQGMPAITFQGGSDFIISDTEYDSNTYKERTWSRNSRRGNSNARTPGPIVHFSGSPEFLVNKSSWTHIADNSTIEIDKNAYIHHSDNVSIETAGNFATKLYDNAQVFMAGNSALKLSRNAGIDIGSGAGQIYFTTDNGRDNNQNIWDQSYSIVTPNGNGKESILIQKDYKGDVLENAKALKSFKWTRFDSSPQFLQQGYSSISFGSDSGHDVIKFGTDGGASFWNITGKGYTYIKFGVDTEGFLGADITPASESSTKIKFGANKKGNMEIYMTGSIFKQMSGGSHFEMHNLSKVIMRGRLIGDTKPWYDQTKTARILTASGEPIHTINGDFDEDYEKPTDSPLLALYDAPAFIMRGTWPEPTLTDTNVPKNWTGRAKKVSGNPLFEMIENSSIIAEGNGSIVIKSNGITINGIEISNEKLAKLLASIGE